MSYEKPPEQGRPLAPINPALLESPGMLAALARQDVATIYRWLEQGGVSQRQIARRTGQSQSEICEIIKGRKVGMYDVLVRICDGLGVPRWLMGLSHYGPDGAYAGDVTVAEPPKGVDVSMQRRDLMAFGAVSVFGAPLFGELLLGPSHAPGAVTELPSKIGMTDVAEIKSSTEQLRAVAAAHGGQARNATEVAARYGRLLVVPADEPVAVALRRELAALHELTGWCCFDSGLDRHARWHYRVAVDLAHQVDDDYRVASALRYAGIVDSVRGHPNDAMKFFQLAQFKLGSNGDPDLNAWLHSVSASALAHMGHEQARSELVAARDGWQATEAVERADQNYQSALVLHELGRSEVAEQYVASVNGEGRHRPVGTFAGVLRATIHVQAGEPRGLGMAKTAIDAVAPLRSVRARERLVPLADALETRPGSDAHELARMARKVAATRV
ncbi:MAG: helix-turn-helix domain-containing protein [Pseudonocardiaceae bacterium]